MVKRLQKFSLVLLAGLGLSIMQTSAQSFYEPFTGTGTLAGHNGWFTALGTADQTNRVEGSLTYQGLKTSEGNKVVLGATNTEYLNRMFDAPVTSGSLYGSALIKVLDTDGLLANGTIGNYFMHFVRAAGSTPYQARVYVRAGSAPNTFNIGILNNTNEGVPTPASGTEMFGTNPTDYAIGQTYLIVFKHDMAANSSSIWVNPTLGGSTEPAAMYTATAGVPTTALAGIAFRQTNNAGKGTGNIEVDEIRIGSTFDEVTPTATTGIKDFAAAGIVLYPNPTSGSVKLQLPASFASKTRIGLTLHSVNGDLLLKLAGSETALNEQLSSKLGSAAAGMYILRIENGSDSYQTRIVKN